jgi:hypothetical protein
MACDSSGSYQAGVPNMDKLPDLWDPATRGIVQRGYLLSSQYKEQADNRKTEAETNEKIAQTGKANADAEKARSETVRRQPNIAGQTNDPAKLVPSYVPKEHQPKVFGEIDAAENTKRMSQSIMDSFDKATTENTVLKTGPTPFGQIRTPASVLALHQALQPTFKDLEGTVRQAAMDNTFKNVTPAPGDSDKTIAEKRQALKDYLQSKASAPTARAYGIDLAKFDSTSAYQDKKKKAPADPSSGSDLIASASAAEPPANSIAMSRNGKTKWIPASMKGAAITDGWDVVK